MQKVVGSSPIIRSERPRSGGVSLWLGTDAGASVSQPCPGFAWLAPTRRFVGADGYSRGVDRLKMPKRPRPHKIERRSRVAFEAILPDHFTYRPISEDYGLDGEVEVFDEKSARALRLPPCQRDPDNTFLPNRSREARSRYEMPPPGRCMRPSLRLVVSQNWRSLQIWSQCLCGGAA